MTKPIIVNRDDLSLTSDQDSYRLGDTPVFTIVSPRDCFLTLTDIDERGEGTVLLPNTFQRDNFIKAGVPIRFPGAGAPFQFRMKDKGIETVTAVCATQASGGDRIQHDFQKNQFTPVPNYTSALAARLRWKRSGQARPRSQGPPTPVPPPFPGRDHRRQGRGSRFGPRSGCRCVDACVFRDLCKCLSRKLHVCMARVELSLARCFGAPVSRACLMFVQK